MQEEGVLYSSGSFYCFVKKGQVSVRPQPMTLLPFAYLCPLLPANPFFMLLSQAMQCSQAVTHTFQPLYTTSTSTAIRLYAINHATNIK